jgi:hypothetical protein
MIAYEMLLCKAGIIARCLPAGPDLRPASAVPDGDSRDSYREDTLSLQDLIGRDLSPWLEGAKG